VFFILETLALFDYLTLS